MNRTYCTSAFLQRTGQKTQAVFGWSQREPMDLPLPAQWAILECFLQPQTPASAYEIYRARQTQSPKMNLSQFGEPLLLKMMQGEVVYLAQGFASYLEPEQQANLTQEVPLFAPYPALAFAEFEQLFQELVMQGLIVPAVGQVAWGDIRRWTPICAITGFSRGTPIDRYYQKQFLQQVKERVRGNVLEIGGVAKDWEFYPFDRQQMTVYCCMNLTAGAGVDVVADAHDPQATTANFWDVVLIFNVLEHCYDPARVIANIHTWLKPGGWCLALVPTAQRLHDRPADYWRLLPDGLRYLFRHYSRCELYTYGNTLTVVATFLGVAAEELTVAELDQHHPDYPVIACVAAQK
ncbi:MAG: methyltransferase domain-containing protein [Gloeomargarita sp. SKYBB_i_bin120]|nr:class I SAM-dependent methyltransferase [Gloeomargarita sp. SKYB120]MDW8177570.1 methyltransferase domain-containing protein [Gloeomargarita sp. SKYBB_i_bin120]